MARYRSKSVKQVSIWYHDVRDLYRMAWRERSGEILYWRFQTEGNKFSTRFGIAGDTGFDNEFIYKMQDDGWHEAPRTHALPPAIETMCAECDEPAYNDFLCSRCRHAAVH